MRTWLYIAIEQRIMSGGHSVPVDDVRRRYERSLENLSTVYQLSDLVLIFDNSSSKREMRRVLEAHRGEITFKDRKLPEWVKRSLGPVIGSRRKSRKKTD